MSFLTTIPEITIQVLTHLPPSRFDDTSVRTLMACTKTCRALRTIAQTDSIWREHCTVRWTKPEGEIRNQQRWYEFYCSRRIIDLQTLDLLDTIITAPSKRGAASTQLDDLREQAWDMLRMEACSRAPEAVRDVWKKEEKEWETERWEGVGEEWQDGTGRTLDDDWERERERDVRDVKSDWIQRRWWAKQALGTLARANAVRTMVRVVLGEQPPVTSLQNARNFEDGLAALSGLMGSNTAEIGHNYDNLAKECQRKLMSDDICVDPADEKFELMAFSAGVCTWMASQGFKKASGDVQYYDLMGHFPHKFMTSNRRALPMSLVCTFVAIVTRLGFLAAPVGFPGHVHAWIAVPSYALDTENYADWEDDVPTKQLHVDVFHSDVGPFLGSDVLRQKLSDLSIPESQMSALMRPSEASEMVLRAANNILHSVTRIQRMHAIHLQADVRGAALYAAAVTFVIARPQADNANHFVGGVVSVVKEQFPLDTEPVLGQLLEYVDPQHSMGMHFRAAISRLRDPSVQAKSRARGVKWWVGMVFKHAVYGYVGVIDAWDDECEAGEEWIAEMGVDELPRGRRQPFYTVLAADGSSRYVAEENVIQLPLIGDEAQTAPEASWKVVRALMLSGTTTIEQNFTRVDVDERTGRMWFVPGVDAVAEYPEDTALGEAYMQRPWHRFE